MDWDAFTALPRRTVPVGAHALSVIDVGDGLPILLLHGNSTWSYMWRHIIEQLSPSFRCIAPDLLGFGHSDKLVRDEDYTWEAHAAALDRLVTSLPRMIVVGHDWGGAFAVHATLQHPDRVAGVVLMEPQLFPESWDDYEGYRRSRFEAFRDPERNVALVEEQNLLIEQLPQAVNRTLSAEEMDGYRHPYPAARDRAPLRRFAEMKPIGEDSETFTVFTELVRRLPELTVPALLFAVEPGTLMPARAIDRLRTAVPHLEVRMLGPGGHHLHEDYSDEISSGILEWAPSLI